MIASVFGGAIQLSPSQDLRLVGIRLELLASTDVDEEGEGRRHPDVVPVESIDQEDLIDAQRVTDVLAQDRRVQTHDDRMAVTVQCLARPDVASEDSREARTVQRREIETFSIHSSELRIDAVDPVDADGPAIDPVRDYVLCCAARAPVHG
jgi:U3 small nucleolar RNA-associated protein 14